MLCGVRKKHLPEPWALHQFGDLTSLRYTACSCGLGRQAAVRTLPQHPSSDGVIQRELFLWGACYSTVGWWKLISTVGMHFEGQIPWHCWHDATFALSRMTFLHQDIICLSVSSVCLLSYCLGTKISEITFFTGMFLMSQQKALWNFSLTFPGWCTDLKPLVLVILLANLQFGGHLQKT